MPGQIPNPIWVYRIVHQQNLEHILKYGLFTKNPPVIDPNYIFIGDPDLTKKRDSHLVSLPGYGYLGDYVPFYFGPRSPMLLKIKTGKGVPMRPQSEIIYICCKLNVIQEAGLRFLFTDGHASKKITEFFDRLDDLDKVDWIAVREKSWHNTLEDRDIERRKQAEFLVHNHVPKELISAVVVFNEEKAYFVNTILNSIGVQIPVHINPKNAFYYL